MSKKLCITKRVSSFETACEVLGLNPNNLPNVEFLPEKDRKSIIAFYQLTIIIRALNEGWEPDWSNWDEYKYFNWFTLSSSGFVYYDTSSTYTYTGVGSRLCFKTRELARYAAIQFKSLYEDYLTLV